MGAPQELAESEYTSTSESEEEPPKTADAEPSNNIGQQVAEIYNITKEDAYKEARLGMEVVVPSKLRASTFIWQNRLPFARSQGRVLLEANAMELHRITTSQIADLAVLLDGL